MEWNTISLRNKSSACRSLGWESVVFVSFFDVNRLASCLAEKSESISEQSIS
jgi:hypothetical protein